MTTTNRTAAGQHKLSMQQEFLCMFDKGNEVGPFGHRYHIVDGWRLHGKIDTDALRQALLDVVERHESLRTTVTRDGDVRAQVIHPASQPELTLHARHGLYPAQRAVAAEELMNSIEAGTFTSTELPLLRAALMQFDDTDSVLVLNSHHTATDAWSMQVIMRDLATFYALRKGLPTPDLPEVEQYRDFAARQWSEAGSSTVKTAQDYWRKKLAGARILSLPTDYETDPAKSADPDFVTSWYRFTYDSELRTNVTDVARMIRGSTFMVLLAAYAVFTANQTGVRDVVSPTFTPGRTEMRTHHTVGSFFNFVPLRIDLSNCWTFRDVLQLARSTCLEGYANELPLGLVLQEAPELMSPTMQPGFVPCVFQSVQSPFHLTPQRAGDIEYTPIWDRRISQPVGSDIPDGMLWSFHFGPSDEIAGLIGYSKSLFAKNTVETMAAQFGQTLRELVAKPDQLI